MKGHHLRDTWHKIIWMDTLGMAALLIIFGFIFLAGMIGEWTSMVYKEFDPIPSYDECEEVIGRLKEFRFRRYRGIRPIELELEDGRVFYIAGVDEKRLAYWQEVQNNVEKGDLVKLRAFGHRPADSTPRILEIYIDGEKYMDFEAARMDRQEINNDNVKSVPYFYTISAFLFLIPGTFLIAQIKEIQRLGRPRKDKEGSRKGLGISILWMKTRTAILVTVLGVACILYGWVQYPKFTDFLDLPYYNQCAQVQGTVSGTEHLKNGLALLTMDDGMRMYLPENLMPVTISVGTDVIAVIGQYDGVSNRIPTALEIVSEETRYSYKDAEDYYRGVAKKRGITIYNFMLVGNLLILFVAIALLIRKGKYFW